MFKQLSAIRLTIIILLFLAGTVRAQQFTGTLQGTVRDTTSAVVVAAEVAITNQNTNVTINTTTSGNGNYIAPQLPPGNYRVTVKKLGFKVATVADIKIDVQQIRAVDITLDIGKTIETVSVSALGATALETTSTTLAQTIENKRIVDLPLNGRNPFSLATLSPGVIPGAGSSPWISGGRNSTSEVTIDGVSNVGANANVSILDLIYQPSVDSVQEFSVQTNTLSAEFGRFGGGVINLITKSGTNSLHLTAYEFMRNSKLDANNFFSNRAGRKPDGSEIAPRGAFQRNQFGGNVGGPVYLPKLYDGRNRTFFFFAMEAQSQRSGSVSQTTVPIDEWRRGDFSNLKNANGQPIVIYDPLTTRANPNFDSTQAVSPTNPQFIRDPFRCNAAGTPIGGSPDVTLPICNKIPGTRISPIARNLMKYWPQPNQIPVNANTQLNNFIVSGKGINDSHQLDLRIDHIISESWRLSSRFSTSSRDAVPLNGFNNEGTSLGDGIDHGDVYSFTHDHTYTLSPTLVLNVRYGFGRNLGTRFPLSKGFDITQLGFPAYVKNAAALQALEFPRIDVDGIASLGQGTFNDVIAATMNHQFNASATKTTARHTFKWGMDYRKLLLNFQQFGQPSGQYIFDPRWTQLDPNNASVTAGFGMASLLLGVPSGGQMSHDPNPASASSYWGWYFQDDWKVTQKLTINLGLRYELDVPRTERYNRLSFFRLDQPSPLAGKVPANPLFDGSKLVGAMNFTTSDNRRQVPTDKNNWGPRIGLAYRLGEKTVIRSAYGIYYAPSALQAAGHTGTAGMDGFSSLTPFVTSIDGRIPITFIDNPFPNGFNFPTGSSLGAATFLGQGPNASLFLDDASPYTQQWNLNLQRELPSSLLFEAAYIGSKGTRLIDGEGGVNLNQLPPSFMSQGTSLQTLVDNPFAGLIPYPTSTLNNPQVQRGQLLRPFPQYTSLASSRKPAGNSIYHALTLRADKRFSNGLSLLVAYTTGKLIDDVSQTVTYLGPAGNKQDAYNRRGDRSISTQDIAQRLVFGYVYELPFGKGKKLLGNAPGFVNHIIGGWQINGIMTYQSGTPLIITQTQNNTGIFSPGQRPNWTGRSARLEGGSTNDKIARWFDTSQFTTSPSFTFGNTPRTMPDVRNPGTKLWDISFFKNNYFGRDKKYNTQFRVEMFNAFNTPQFSGPGTQVGSSNFGVISGAGSARQIQMALKLIM